MLVVFFNSQVCLMKLVEEHPWDLNDSNWFDLEMIVTILSIPDAVLTSEMVAFAFQFSCFIRIITRCPDVL